MSSTSFVRYTDSVETIQPNEQQTFHDLDALFIRLGNLMLDRFRHAVRGVHAKSHGMLVGKMTVLDSMPAEYKQGLFASPATYDVLFRFSTNPGDVLADSVSTPRGIAIKVMSVPGPFVTSAAAQAASQDFVLAVGSTFAAKDAAEFLKVQKLIELNANDPEPFKKVVSAGARVTNAVLGIVGLESPKLAALGYPSTHPLGEEYFSQAPIRFGDYIAKIVVRPKSEKLKELARHSITSAFHYSALKDAIVEFFNDESGEWEVGAQLCTDLDKMPVENPTVEWDEKISPYIPIATISVSQQPAFSNSRRVLVDDRIAFSPWNAMEAHRPLGSIMRARKSAYEASATFRMDSNAVCPFHAKNATEIPD